MSLNSSENAEDSSEVRKNPKDDGPVLSPASSD